MCLAVSRLGPREEKRSGDWKEVGVRAGVEAKNVISLCPKKI